MAASYKDISEWFDHGVKNKEDFLIVVCDTYDYDDYPVWVKTKQFWKVYKGFNPDNMQRVMEVYDLRKPKEPQMEQDRCWNLPES